MQAGNLEEGNPLVYFEETNSKVTIKNHFHNAQQIFFILEGCALIRLDQKEYICRGPCIFILSNLENHSVEITEYPYRRYVLIIPQVFMYMQDSPLFSILLQRPQNFSHRITLSPSAANSLLPLFASMETECREKRPYWQTVAAWGFTRLLVALYRVSPESFPGYPMAGISEVVLAMQKAIAENCGQAYSLEAFSKQYFISKYHLSRAFQRITGYHYKEYVILQRISAAKELLAHTGMSISAVASKCGYANENHFIRSFKAITGKTPGSFRLEQKKMYFSVKE